MNKIILERKNGVWYLVGALTVEEADTIQQDILDLKNRVVEIQGCLDLSDLVQLEDYNNINYTDVFK